LSGHLLDASVISELAPDRTARREVLADWLRAHGEALFVPVIAVAEIEQGIAKLHRKGDEERAVRLSAWLDRLVDGFGERVLAVDAIVARRAGAISDVATAAGDHPGLADVLIAATAAVHGLAVATRNTRHFEPLGVPCADPFGGRAPGGR
jgi:predicted nucleic acid-binding protein